MKRKGEKGGLKFKYWRCNRESTSFIVYSCPTKGIAATETNLPFVLTRILYDNKLGVLRWKMWRHCWKGDGGC